MLKLCNIVNHSKVIVTFSFKKACINFNFVNVHFNILDFWQRILKQLTIYLFLLKGLHHTNNNESFNLHQNFFPFFLYWAKCITNKKDFSNS